jgi:hypothetical protein
LYATQADYLDPESDYHFLSESDLIRPQLVFEKTIETKDDITGTTRFIEIIEATMPRHRVRKRLKNYIEYLEDGYWQDETNEDEPNPIVMFICPTLTDLIYCKRATKRLLEEKWNEDITMWFTTTERLKRKGWLGRFGKKSARQRMITKTRKKMTRIDAALIRTFVCTQTEVGLFL